MESDCQFPLVATTLSVLAVMVSFTMGTMYTAGRVDSLRFCVQRLLRALFELRFNKPKRIFIVRHGQSMGNVDESVYERIPDHEVPLSKAGWDQAIKVGQTLRDRFPPTSHLRVYVSPYRRCRETLEGILRGLRYDERLVTVREEPRLRELEFGNYQRGDDMRRMKEERQRYGPFYYRFASGESGADVYDRVTSLWETLFREWRAPKRRDEYLIVTHGLTARLLLMRYFRWSVDDFHRLRNLRNCEIKELRLQRDGTFHLATPMLGFDGQETPVPRRFA